MGMTMAEKILASRRGKSIVRPGEYVWANVDGTGVFSPIPLMDKLGIIEVFDRERIYAVNDHFAPSPTVQQGSIRRLGARANGPIPSRGSCSRSCRRANCPSAFPNTDSVTEW
jgi:homoaconitase/3-isopropylmalate dehydratase large subunit